VLTIGCEATGPLHAQPSRAVKSPCRMRPGNPRLLGYSAVAANRRLRAWTP
jgi:hypothetical protein